MVRLSASLLVVAACLAFPACKRAADVANTAVPPSKAGERSSAQAKGEDTLIQQAASSCRLRIQKAAMEHAANTKHFNEVKVLDMKEVTRREQVETKREAVRKFLASNEALKSLLVNEEANFAEELARLNLPQARITSAVREFQSGVPGKAVAIRIRGTDQRIGDSVLGALDFLDETWGQWNYNKEYEQVQFSPPGALKKYTVFMEAIEAAYREQNELQEQLKTQVNPGS